jgi:hypothetical protein
LNSLLLDADVIIDAHRLGIWDKLLAQNKVHIGSVVLRTEAEYYIDNKGRRRNINLMSQHRAKKITELSATLAEQRILKERFDAVLGPKLDPGEIESLVILERTPELTFCTFDHATITAVVLLDMGNRVISFETLLKQCGLSRKPQRKHSEGRFKQIVKRAQLMRVMGQGLIYRDAKLLGDADRVLTMSIRYG